MTCKSHCCKEVVQRWSRLAVLHCDWTHIVTKPHRRHHTMTMSVLNVVLKKDTHRSIIMYRASKNARSVEEFNIVKDASDEETPQLKFWCNLLGKALIFLNLTSRSILKCRYAESKIEQTTCRIHSHTSTITVKFRRNRSCF